MEGCKIFLKRLTVNVLATVGTLNRAAVQNQITATRKSIILQEKPKTNLLLYMKNGSTYAVDASVSVFVSLYWFKLHMNCFHVCWTFRIKFRTII